MNIELSKALVAAVLALLAGKLILVAPRSLNLRGPVSERRRFGTTEPRGRRPALLPDWQPVTMQPVEENT
jgi:hypothetical protein